MKNMRKTLRRQAGVFVKTGDTIWICSECGRIFSTSSLKFFDESVKEYICNDCHKIDKLREIKKL